ncbi:MAG: uroporphyrinogen decarboxylase family protein [Bacillota bacterium]|nr:uroporphyrinogen decarboxylase family protein [Bacillota bacterium]
MQDIRQLLEQYVQIVESPRNQVSRKYWENADEPYLAERWRGRSRRKEQTPFTIALDISGYARVLDINCVDYYSKAEDQLRQQLRYAIWEYENIPGHRYFEPTVFISFGSVFEVSFFGAKIHYLPKQAPWYNEKEHVLVEKTDLLAMRQFDFFNSGLCAKAHEFYGEMKRMTEGYPLKVMFPVTLRSPFSIALMLRGYTELLIDTCDDPEFFCDLMATVTNYLKQYACQRAAFLGEPIPRMKLFNDEISSTVISRKMYEDLILPYEIDLAEFTHGISYWHSCSSTTDLYAAINQLPGLQMMHIGPWSDVRKAADVFAEKDVCLEICLNSVADIYDQEEDTMRKKLLLIRDACDKRIRYQVRADGFAVMNTVDAMLEKVKTWGRVAGEVFPG